LCVWYRRNVFVILNVAYFATLYRMRLICNFSVLTISQDYMQKHLDDLVSEVDENAGLHNSGRPADDEVSSSNTSDSVHMPHNTVVLDSNSSSSSSEDSDYYNDELRDKKRKCDLATIDTVAVTEKKPREI